MADEALYAKYARTAAHPQVGRILAQISRNLGGRFCAVLVPSKYQVYAGYEWTLKPLGFRPGTRLPTAIQHAVEASGTQHGYCVLNPFTAVIDRERTERLYYAVDDHPNAAGNCVLARQVFVDLAARDLAGSTLAAPDCAPQ